MRLAGVRIGSGDLPAAIAAYELLLQLPGSPLPEGGRRFRLERGRVDVVAGEGGLRAVCFVGDAADATLPAALGIDVTVEPEDEAAEPPGPGPAIDHVVVRDVGPARAIALWRGRLGVRVE